MEFHWRVALACISVVLLVQLTTCESSLAQPNSLKWTCICNADPLENAPAFNSSSCGCIYGTTDRMTWNCSCSTLNRQAPRNILHNTSFSSCNCTLDLAGTPAVSEKHLSKKALLIIVLLCAAFATVALVALSTYCFYCNNRLPMQLSQTPSVKDTSYNSSANLISHRSAQFQPYQSKTCFFLKPISEIIQKLPFMFGSGKGTLSGVVIQFSYVELEQASKGFSTDNLIGIGGSSNVYRGELKDGRMVAIKKLRPLGGSEIDPEFLHEIELILRFNHCHVVLLLGYCIENQGRQLERLLVFEYMSNGNLRDSLDTKQGKEAMDWETRVQIALGAAKGLEYLHEAAAPRILHRDIKTTNILLDDNYRAKIADLGMAKQLMTDDLTSSSSSPARMLGTFGYFAPEYAIVGKASQKSDVFSFGVVILELITGRRPIFKATNKGEDSLVIWATSRLQDSQLVVSELPDAVLRGKFPEEEMQIMAHLARECLQWDPDSRPTMSEVVQILLTIAPGKSRKRNMPTSLEWSSYAPSTRESSLIQNTAVTIERHEPSGVRSARSHPPRSMSIPIEQQYLCKEHQIELEIEHTDRLIPSRSNSWSGRSSEDEIVDMFEPCFESFRQANMAPSLFHVDTVG
ncbi:receptor-like serine/threonine-protein kinase NCRK isoform X1 [Zingiber officinale]|uniref:receptor-like serine/threonine-protein kinase NCRK isoform X1 n=1 Tax=Zingiber officinale TaxID=94328 RepID=UPI001C4B2436|nr:receptor-like serine/threonine-protein kinase NCRK isoform X1 [Zingiber officinale]XP_042401979.1 receptor-like serine/threonine-protein kinase NCRK isoform X1 [Zingiber officinale]